MRTVVCMRHGLDPNSVKISRSREELDLREATWITRREDKAALEAALRVREMSGEGEVIALVVGSSAADDVAREAIAMGADKAILVVTTAETGGRGTTALLAAAIARLGDADLVLTGQPAELDAAGDLAPRLAVRLNRPVLIGVLAFEASSSGMAALVGDGGTAHRSPVLLPVVAEVMAAAQRPRYPHPARIAVAWDPGFVEEWPADGLGIAPDTLASEVSLGGLALGPERQRGQTISGSPPDAAKELVSLLRGRLRGKRII